jgi:tetratricopeptide (TPR) repeat protein
MDIQNQQLVEKAKERFAVQDYYGCVHILDELVASGRAFADAYHLLGLAYHLSGRPEKALEELDNALRLNPHYIEAHVHRGIVLNELGRSDEAEVAFASGRESRQEDREGIPAHSAAKLANLHAELGEAYADAGAMNQAIDQFKSALGLGPEFHDLRYRLGRFLLDAGRSLEAREELELVVEARPEFPDGRAALGLACYVSGDAPSAHDIWTQLQVDFPDDPRARAYLAMIQRTSVG